jgi:adenylate cyclase
MRSDGCVLRWFKRRSTAHLLIAAFFVLPFVELLRIVPDSNQPFASKIKLWFDSLEYQSIDYRMQFGRKAIADPQIVLLSIDEPSIYLDSFDDATIAASRPLSLMHAKGFPFPREVYADVCDTLFAAGAKVVAFDLIFQTSSPSDPVFQQALAKYHDGAVIGFPINADSTTCRVPPATILPSGDPLDAQVGFLNFWRDTDNTIRSAQYRDNLGHLNRNPGAENLPKLYSFAARIVQKAGDDKLIPDDFESRPLRFTGATPFPTYSLYKIFDAPSWRKDFRNGDFFRGKIVVVGPAGNWSKDTLPTPAGDLSGVEVHLNAINALLHNQFLYSPSTLLVFSTVIGAGLIALLLALAVVPIAWRFLVTLGLFGGYAAGILWAYDGPGWLLPAVAPMSVFCGATGVGFIYDFVLTQIEKLRLRTTFERYNSKNVVKYLLQHTESYNEMLAGTRRPVTALFSDVRNFTTMAESSDSHALVAKLNEYLTAMVECLFRFDGTLDCFMGDGIMAVWGNTPFDFGPKEDAALAVRSALAMIVELRKLNAKWLAEGKTEWRVGIGLNHGQVIVGDIGSKTNKRFATIGDAINLASRIEGLTKEFHVDLMIGETVADLIRDKFYLKSVALVKVKGKNLAVETFTVLGEKTESLSPNEKVFLPLYEGGIVCFRKGEFVRARELFSEALQIQPTDFLANYYLEGCLEMIETPPDETWSGIRVMTKK